MSKFITYFRVSTKKQGSSGLGLEAQRQIVTNYLRSQTKNIDSPEENVEITEYVEVESGKNSDRPQLRAALHQCKTIGATLVVAKLDRLARNVQFMSTLMNSGVDFIACDMPSANRMTIHIMAALAEEEARLISERTKAALAIAKQRGTKLGGFRGVRTTFDTTTVQRRTTASTKLQKTYSSILPVITTLRSRGETHAQIAQALNEQGLTTSKGKRFTGSTVHRILETLQRTAS